MEKWSEMRCWDTAPPSCCTTASSTAQTRQRSDRQMLPLLLFFLLPVLTERQAFACRTCGGILPVQSIPKSVANRTRGLKCVACGDDGQVVRINVPYVYRYLTAELSAMNIRLALDLQSIEH